MKRIPPPEWAPRHAQAVVEESGDEGDVAKRIITPLLPQIYSELDRRINEFVNDPDQCFHDLKNFPQYDRLDGQYYIGSETFEGDSDGETFCLWLMVRCTEKQDASGPSQYGYDYLGLEAIVTVDREGGHFEFDEGFNTSSI